LVMFIAGAAALVAVVVVDILRARGFERAEVRELRKELEKARMIARTAMSAVSVLVLKFEVAVGSGCVSVDVSVI
jgi:hypothetical protein